MRTPNLQAPLSMPSVTVWGSLGLVPRRPPAARCTCRGCFCSHAGRGGRAEPRPAPRNPAGGGVGCCGVLKVKAEAGAWSDVTGSGVRLPVHRCKGPGDSTGHCTGKCRDGPCSEDTPPPASAPKISPARPAGSLLHRCRLTILRRDLNPAAFAEKSPLRVLKVSVFAQSTAPYCVSSVDHLTRPLPPPHLPLPRPLGPSAPKK